MAAVPETPIVGKLLITPDPALPKVKILVQRDRVNEVVGLFYSEDGGVTMRPFLPVPAEGDKPGSVLTLNNRKRGVWKMPAVPTVDPLSGSVTFVEETFAGQLIVGEAFGYFRVPAGVTLKCIELQAFLQSTSDGLIRIDLLKESVAQEKVVSITTGATEGIKTLSVAVVMEQNTVWRFKILEAGTQPGEQLKVRMVLARN